MSVPHTRRIAESWAYFDRSSIYAYGIATPSGAVSADDPHSADYANIFNIIEFNDPVPLVPPGVWDFQRYGTTLILPYRESGLNPENAEYFTRLRQRLNAGRGYTPDKFKNYYMKPASGGRISAPVSDPANHDTQGVMMKKAINGLASVLGTREGYVRTFQGNAMAIVPKIFREGVRESLPGLFTTVVKKELPEFINRYPDLSATIISNPEEVLSFHADHEYYLTWMQMMDENYPDALPLIWGDSFYRTFTVAGAADVYVYDADAPSGAVASIVNDTPSGSGGTTQEIIASVYRDGSKTVFLPVGRSYRIEVVARSADGSSAGAAGQSKVFCTVDEYDAGSGAATRKVEFRTASLEEGAVLTAVVPAFTEAELAGGAHDGSDAPYTVSRGGAGLEIAADLRREELTRMSDGNLINIAGCKVALIPLKYIYNGKVQVPSVIVRDGFTTLKAGEDYVVTGRSVNAGEAFAVVSGIGKYSGRVEVPFTIDRGYNSITKVTASKKIRYAKLRRKTQTFRIAATVRGGAKKTFALKSVPKKAKRYIRVSSAGKVTVKKRLPRGTYKIRVRITAGATANYNKAAVTKTVKIVVK